MNSLFYFKKSPPRSPSLTKRGRGEIFLFFFFLIQSSAYGGDLSQKVQEAYRNTPALEARFVQRTYVEILEKEVIEKGTLLLAKPGRFKISYEGKRERAYISDGKRLWIIHPGEKEVIDDIRSQVSPE
ncbi:MAG: outer membrane lipoprotein carrier protein LolA, partial [Deltaproteobacteria bacterium]|nr:outer membrane lipoprotein carrier protein LolA [Deltaproteobacteria bacterium]